MKKNSLFTFIVLTLFSFSNLFADEAVENSSSGSPISSDIEEIVVTARAKDESIRDIPVAITAYTEEEMENLNINTLDDLAASSASYK